MILSLISYKGGVGKTTTAIHIAAYLAQKGPTLLIDGDPNRSALEWARDGELPFKVIDERQTTRYAKSAEHFVLDTKARPEYADLKEIVENCDFLVVPSEPDRLSLQALRGTLEALSQLKFDRYKVLITKVPPRPNRDGEQALAVLQDAGIPVFSTVIRRLQVYRSAVDISAPVYKVKDQYAQEAWRDYVAVCEELGL
jgi:chromosome partitioning protein